ncbi:MAG: 4Fe-4S binding protein [bacterium]
MNLKIIIIIVFILFLTGARESQTQCGSCNKCYEKIQLTKNHVKIQNREYKTNINNETKVSGTTSDNNKVDEFEEFSDYDKSKESSNSSNTKNSKLLTLNSQSGTILIVLFSVIIAGFFVRFKPLRHLRVLFMLGFLIYLGFYLGGCPCPISAYQNLILTTLGKDVDIIPMLYFIGLIPITYVFGKVWCGWICHLGTLQELLHIHKKFNFLKSNKTLKIMRSIRWILFFGLIFQLALTQTNWFCKIDPFLVAFNFISVYQIGWYLLVLLILTSIFIHRPFCQSVCPIGLVLGWISKIPGASALSYNENCTNCNICLDTCKIGAITKNNGEHMINNAECNLCGDCLDSCTKNAIKPIRKKH